MSGRSGKGKTPVLATEGLRVGLDGGRRKQRLPRERRPRQCCYCCCYCCCQVPGLRWPERKRNAHGKRHGCGRMSRTRDNTLPISAQQTIGRGWSAGNPLASSLAKRTTCRDYKQQSLVAWVESVHRHRMVQSSYINLLGYLCRVECRPKVYHFTPSRKRQCRLGSSESLFRLWKIIK